MTENLWQFRYHRGPAPMDGIIRASSEEKAMAVATAWCRKNGMRPPAAVRPMVLADETILVSEGLPQLPKLPDAVGATTAVQGFK